MTTLETKKIRETFDLLKINRTFLNKMPGNTGISRNIWNKLIKLIEIMDNYVIDHSLIKDDRYIYISFDAGTIYGILKTLDTGRHINAENVDLLNEIYDRYMKELV